MVVFTHPDYATLVDPLFRKRKRGLEKILQNILFRRRRREGGRAKPRPGELSQGM